MRTISIEIPEEFLISVKIPESHLEIELKKELALQLYREGMISFANAHKLAELTKIEFHHLPGVRKIARQYNINEYLKDIKNIKKFENQN